MVQRKPKGNWTCTGIFAKVGNPNKIVTNYYQGGRLYTLDNVFNKMNLSSAEKESRKSQLNKIASDVAKFPLKKIDRSMYNRIFSLQADVKLNLLLCAS
jgi:hypothetical protein